MAASSFGRKRSHTADPNHPRSTAGRLAWLTRNGWRQFWHSDGGLSVSKGTQTFKVDEPTEARTVLLAYEAVREWEGVEMNQRPIL